MIKIIYALQKNKRIADRIEEEKEKYWNEHNEAKYAISLSKGIAHERSEFTFLVNLFGKEMARALEDLSQLEFIISCLDEEEESDGKVIPKFYSGRDNILFIYEEGYSIEVIINSRWDGSFVYKFINKEDIDMKQVLDTPVSIW